MQGFLNTLYDARQDKGIYSKWLAHVDREFESILRSEGFASLLSDYVDSMIDLRRMFRNTGIPVDIMDCMFDSYVHNMMVFANIPSKFELTPSKVFRL